MKTKLGNGPRGLKPSEVACGVVALVFWALLLTAGLTVATLPYRIQVSPLATTSEVAARIETMSRDAARIRTARRVFQTHDTSTLRDSASHGVRELDSLAVHITELAGSIDRALTSRGDWGDRVWAWVYILLCFTPVNILLLSVLSGVLGSLGCKANVDWRRSSESGQEKVRCDQINPVFSGTVRGLFVYLMLISGLLILSDDPFAELSSGRYVRLAGVTSLASFLVSLRGEVFAQFLTRAVRPDRQEIPAGREPKEVEKEIR